MGAQRDLTASNYGFTSSQLKIEGAVDECSAEFGRLSLHVRIAVLNRAIWSQICTP